jgi:hypothetical protein
MKCVQIYNWAQDFNSPNKLTTFPIGNGAHVWKPASEWMCRKTKHVWIYNWAQDFSSPNNQDYMIERGEVRVDVQNNKVCTDLQLSVKLQFTEWPGLLDSEQWSERWSLSGYAGKQSVIVSSEVRGEVWVDMCKNQHVQIYNWAWDFSSLKLLESERWNPSGCVEKRSVYGIDNWAQDFSSPNNQDYRRVYGFTTECETSVHWTIRTTW